MGAPRDAGWADGVALTGATGFIGLHAVRRLVELGARPTVLARSPRPATEPAMGEDRVRWRQLDLLDGDAAAGVLRDERPAVLLHLAGTRGVAAGERAASACTELNVLATVRLLEAARRASVGRIVLLGSAAEYGAHRGALHEELALAPRSPYGASKAAATWLALAMHAQGGCPVVVLRPFSVYGPGQPSDMFVAEAVACAVAGTPFRMSEGLQRRDLVFVGDLVEALLTAARTPGIDGSVINVGSGEARRLRDVAERIWQLSGSGAPLLVGALPADQPHDTWADVARARRLLGWRAETDLDAGLLATITWARRERDGR